MMLRYAVMRRTPAVWAAAPVVKPRYYADKQVDAAWNTLISSSGLQKAIDKAKKEVETDPVLNEIEEFFSQDANAEMGKNMKQALSGFAEKGQNEFAYLEKEIPEVSDDFVADFEANMAAMRAELKEEFDATHREFLDREPERRKNRFFTEEEEKKYQNPTFLN